VAVFSIHPLLEGELGISRVKILNSHGQGLFRVSAASIVVQRLAIEIFNIKYE